MVLPSASFNARTSSALARPCSLILPPLAPLRPRQTNESSVSTLRSAVSNVAIIGATSSRTQSVTVSAIEQRSTGDGNRATRCPSDNSTDSRETTSLATHSPGPVIGGIGLNSANPASCCWHRDDRVAGDCPDWSPGISAGRERGSGISADAIEQALTTRAKT